MQLIRGIRQNFSKKTSQYFIDLEEQYGCHNYHPLPVVIARAKGQYVWDQEGKKYLDFLAGYSAVNQGHCHDKIFAEFVRQGQLVTLTSRAFYNNKLGEAEQYLTNLFGYQKVLMMNSGVEAGESAVKLARRWAYNVKGVKDNQARVLFAKGNFWGRTIAACGSSDDPERYRKFGPFEGLNFDLVDYNNLAELEKKFQSNNNYAGFFMEPIQGEKGVLIPHPGYLKGVRDLCTKYNVLFIADEIQTGLGRTGKMLACDHEGVRPDMVLLGKALSGGFYPISAVLCDDNIMLQIKPGEHGSTYGGNPLASALAIKSLQVLLDENLINRSADLGTILLNSLKKLKSPLIKEARGRGLMCALEFNSTDPEFAWNFCLKMKDHGLITKPTHGSTIRLTPTFVIEQQELEQSVSEMQKILDNL